MKMIKKLYNRFSFLFLHGKSSLYRTKCDTFCEVFLKERIDDKQRQHGDKCDCHTDRGCRQLCHLGTDISGYFSTCQVLNIGDHLVQQVLDTVKLLAFIS